MARSARAVNGEVLHPQRLGGDLGRVAGELLFHLPAHHPLDELLLRQLGGKGAADELPVSKHGDPVREPVDLLQPVGDVHDSPVLALQLSHQGEEGFHVVGVQGAGRLVHDENARVQPDGLGDLDELLHGDGKILDEGEPG